jgi:hypothetical protein
MKFELKSAKTTGGVTSLNDGTMKQQVNIVIGPVGCHYSDVAAQRTIEYIFSENLTAKQIEDGIQPFAAQWAETNYPEKND